MGITVEELRAAFADTLDKPHSVAGIKLHFIDDCGEERIYSGFPYTLDPRDGGVLEVGSYGRDLVSPPSDYRSRIKTIPVPSIISFERS